MTVPYKFIQRERNKLGIEDLRYHDLRREGVSHLFEKVAQVTSHINLNILWLVYTQLFPHKLHNHLGRPSLSS
jgi:integrase